MVDAQVDAPVEPFRRILVVDDDTFFNTLVTIALQRVGYSVATASDGEGAWDALQAEPFDLMVTDYSMPRLNGLDLLRRMRQHRFNLPSILMSARMPEDIAAVLEVVSTAGSLRKPFGLHELYFKVGSLLDAARLAAADPPRSGPQDSRDQGRKERVEIRRAALLRRTELAEVILVRLALRANARGDRNPVVVLCQQLREYLFKLWGLFGFRALLNRAVALARPEVSWLSGVSVSKQGDLEGMPPVGLVLNPAELHRGEVILLTRVLELVVNLLGESVARACLQDVWQAEL